MSRSSFIEILKSMTLEEINQYIKDNGKVKEPKSYNCPWYINIDRVNKDNKNQ